MKSCPTTHRSRPRFLARSLTALVVVAALAGSGCGVRLSTPSTKLPKLSAEQTLQDSLARRLDAVEVGARALAAGELPTDSTDPEDTATPTETTGPAASAVPTTENSGAGLDAEALTALADRNATRLTALGGVWEPWPTATPKGAELGPERRAPAHSQEQILEELWATSGATREAVSRASDPETTRLYVSLYVGVMQDIIVLSTALGKPVTSPTAGVTASSIDPSTPTPGTTTGEPAASEGPTAGAPAGSAAPETNASAAPTAPNSAASPSAAGSAWSQNSIDALENLRWYAETAAIKTTSDTERTELTDLALQLRDELLVAFAAGSPGPKIAFLPFDDSRTPREWVAAAVPPVLNSLITDVVGAPAESRAAQLDRLAPFINWYLTLGGVPEALPGTATP